MIHPPEDTYQQSNQHECKEEIPTPKPEQEQLDVKEEPESGFSASLDGFQLIT